MNLRMLYSMFQEGDSRVKVLTNGLGEKRYQPKLSNGYLLGTDRWYFPELNNSFTGGYIMNSPETYWSKKRAIWVSVRADYRYMKKDFR